MTKFDPLRCSLIEQLGKASVWRGNLPLTASGEFAYHELAIALDIKPNVSLVDISLIDNVRNSERDVWLSELKAFDVSPSEFPDTPNTPPQFNQPKWRAARVQGDGIRLGKQTYPGHLCWWQIEGGANPTTLGPNEKSYNFIGLIEYLGVLRKGTGLLLYIHCMNGTDRTGAVTAAYAMRHMGMSLKESLAFAASVKDAGEMSAPYKELVGAYSEWLAQDLST